MKKSLGIICTANDLGKLLKKSFQEDNLYCGCISVARPLKQGETTPLGQDVFSYTCTHYLAHLSELSPSQAKELKARNPGCEIFAFSGNSEERNQYSGLVKFFDIAPDAWEACKMSGREEPV